MIELQDIKDSNIEDIVNLLLEEKDQPFEIYVPKSTLLYHSTAEAIANDYAKLAYIGQILHETAESFEYDYVPPHIHESVLFRVKITDLTKLAQVILELSYEYNNDNGEDSYFLDDVYQFIDDVENNIKAPACSDLIETYNEFLEEIEEEND